MRILVLLMIDYLVLEVGILSYLYMELVTLHIGINSHIKTFFLHGSPSLLLVETPNTHTMLFSEAVEYMHMLDEQEG